MGDDTADERGHHHPEAGFDLDGRLAAREERGLRRDLAPTERVAARSRVAADPRGEPPTFDGPERLLFATNDYLGLAGDERVQRAATEAAKAVGTGAGASRLVTGDTLAHRALVFSSGYAANVGTITALAPDVLLSDESNHASIVDGCRLANAETIVYDHCDADALAAALADRSRATGDETRLVVTDSVFSMDGDVAPLAAICDVAERHGAWVMVDEAHATGLYDGAGGIVQRESLGERVQVQLGTLSKALGSQGGYVAGSDTLIEHLLNAARSFVFSTGLAPPAAGAAREALAIADEDERRHRLWSAVDRLREGLEATGYTVLGETQILPVLVGDRAKAMALADRLVDHGIVAPAIRPPTVPSGTSRIRVAPMATHTDAGLERCLRAFRGAGRAVGVLDE